jgi:hypothetical protein
MTDRAAAKPDLLTAAMVRWFDELAAQGIFTTDTAGDSQLEPLAEEHTGSGGRIGRPLFNVCPDIVTRGFESHYRAARREEARSAHRFHRYLIAGRAEGMQSASRRRRTARSWAPSPSSRRERAGGERARAAPDRDLGHGRAYGEAVRRTVHAT